MPLDLHSASPDERVAAYRNVHDVWGGGLSLEAHVARRLASVQHNRADWYVGTVDGRVAVSLACYPLRFFCHGEQIDGFSIGSVHTHADFRRRGYAGELMRWIEPVRREQGARLALLYSDIDCNYYARLGYRECPAWEGFAAADTASSPLSGWRLAPLDASTSLDDLMQRYEAYHGSGALAVARPREYWDYTLAKQPDDEFFDVQTSAGDARGYVRLATSGDVLRIADYALDGDDAQLQENLLSLVVRLAAERKLRGVSTWLPDWPAARDSFDFRPRPQEITMVKSLDDGLDLDAAALAAAHRFCEIDHV